MRLLLLVPLFLMACGDTRLPVTDGRISTAEEFEVTVAGNFFTTNDLSIAIRRDGTFAGTEKGTHFAGRWQFRDGTLCATRTEPQPTPTDCQIWTVKGKSFTVMRNQGRGPNTTYVYRYPLPPSYEQRIAAAR